MSSEEDLCLWQVDSCNWITTDALDLKHPLNSFILGVLCTAVGV